MLNSERFLKDKNNQEPLWIRELKEGVFFFGFRGFREDYLAAFFLIAIRNGALH